jgi:hypothetical protein
MHIDSHLLHRIVRQMARERQYETDEHKLWNARASTSERAEVADRRTRHSHWEFSWSVLFQSKVWNEWAGRKYIARESALSLDTKITGDNNCSTNS